MVKCAVACCTMRSDRDHLDGVKFYRIPIGHSNRKLRNHVTVEGRRLLWLSRLNKRDPIEKSYYRICSRHFISGAPAAEDDIENPDWLPSLNLGSFPNCVPNEISEESSEFEPGKPVSGQSQDADGLQAIELDWSLPQEPADDKFGGPSSSIQPIDEDLTSFGEEGQCQIRRPKEEVGNIVDGQTQHYEFAEDSTAEMSIKEEVCDLFDNGETQHNEFAEDSKVGVTVMEEWLLALDAQYSELKKDYVKLRNRLTEAEVDKLELSEAVRSREELCGGHVKEINDLKREVYNAQNEAYSSLKYIRELNANLQASQSQVVDLQKKLESYEQQCSCMRAVKRILPGLTIRVTTH